MPKLSRCRVQERTAGALAAKLSRIKIAMMPIFKALDGRDARPPTSATSGSSRRIRLQRGPFCHLPARAGRAVHQGRHEREGRLRGVRRAVGSGRCAPKASNPVMKTVTMRNSHGQPYHGRDPGLSADGNASAWSYLARNIGGAFPLFRQMNGRVRGPPVWESRMASPRHWKVSTGGSEARQSLRS